MVIGLNACPLMVARGPSCLPEVFEGRADEAAPSSSAEGEADATLDAAAAAVVSGAALSATSSMAE